MTGGINSQTSSSSDNINTNVDTSGGIQASVKSAELPSASTLIIKDSSEASEEKEKKKDYSRSAAKPEIPPPTGEAGSVNEAAIAQLYNPEKFIEFLKSSDIGPGVLTPQQKEELAKVKVDDKEIIALAAQLGISPGEAQAKLAVTSAFYFKQLIKDLPEDQQNKLIFAQNNPESAKNLSPALKALLANINQTIAKELIADTSVFKFSESWPGVPPDKANFNEEVTAEFDSTFEKKISDMKMGEQITPEQALNLRTMHYTPGAFANDKTLQALFSKVEGSVVADLRNKYGTDADWTPKADANNMNQITDGFFRQNFQTQLNAYQPPLTESQKQEVMNLFANPTTAPSSVEIGKISKTITTASINATITKFGLESTWTPVVGPIINPNIDAAGFKVATDAFNTAKSLYNKFSTMINGLPEGPIKSAYLDYLKVIGESLGQLQEFLYSLSSADATTSKKMSKANMEITLADIKRAQKQVDEAKAKEEDTKTLDTGGLGDFNKWIGDIMSLVISFCVAGPVGLIIALAYFIDKCVSEDTGQPSKFSEMFDAINELPIGPGGQAVLTGLTSFVLSSGNPMMCLSMVGEAKSVQKLVESFGGDTMAQEITAAVFGAVAQIALMVAMMFCGGPAAATFMTSVMATITNISATAAKLAKVVNNIINVISLVFNIVMGTLQATQQGLQANWELVQAEITTILSKSEAASEEVKALISTLKKLIQKLLDGLNGISEDILTISKTQGQKWTAASSITADIQG